MTFSAIKSCLTPDKILNASKLLENILDRQKSQPLSTPDLARGNAGRLLLFAHMYEATKIDKYKEICKPIIEQILLQLEHVPSEPGLFDGFVGALWTLQYAKQVGISEAYYDSNLDKSLVPYISNHLSLNHFDLISGSCGIGNYGLTRLEEPYGIEIVREVVNHLDSCKVKMETGVSWRTNAFGGDFFDVGFAHGVTGIISFLSMVVLYDLDIKKASILLNESIDWIISILDEYGEKLFLSELENQRSKRRDAWCYGNPSISLALLIAAKATSRNDLFEIGKNFALRSSARPLNMVNVADACLCHGSTGLMMIFCLLSDKIKDTRLENRAIDWFNITLDYSNEHNTGQTLSQSPFLFQKDHDLRTQASGFLLGECGVALGLATLLMSHDPPAWMDVMQLAC